MYRIETLNGNKWLHTSACSPSYTATDESKSLASRYSQNHGQVETLEEAFELIPLIMELTKTRGCIRIVNEKGEVVG